MLDRTDMGDQASDLLEHCTRERWLNGELCCRTDDIASIRRIALLRVMTAARVGWSIVTVVDAFVI
jgi:hypothetical protein